MKALLAAGALCVSLAFAIPMSLAQTTTPPATTTSSTTETVTTPAATPDASPSTTSSSSTSVTTETPAGGSQTTTMSTSVTTTPGSCHTRHSAGQSCSCLSAPTTMGVATEQGGRMMCVVGG